MSWVRRVEPRAPDQQGTLRATLFGDFALSNGGEDVRPRSRKSAALLAYLIASDRKLASRSKLASLFWSDRGDDQARASLRQAIADLRSGRSILAAALNVSRQEVALVPDRIVSDVDRIMRAADTLDGGELARAVEEIQGDFLDDFDDVSPAFAEWLRTERIRQREDLFAAILGVIPRLDDGASKDIGRLLTAMERIDPLNEHVVRLRLERAHAAGDTASMHRCYRRLLDELSRELSVAPAKATRELFERLLGRKEPADPFQRSNNLITPRMPPIVVVSAFAASENDRVSPLACIITEDVRISLARCSTLRVHMDELPETDHVRAAARSAIAAYTLTGRVRRFGEGISINVQLGKISSGLLIWSDQIRSEVVNTNLIDEVVARISGAVRAAVERDIVRLDRRDDQAQSNENDVTLLYARGRRLVREARTLAAAEESARLLERVLLIDPNHVQARLRLAQLYNTDFQHLIAGHNVEELRSKALRLTTEAADLDPADVQVQLRLAWCYLRKREWSKAKRMLLGAVAAMPHDADAMNECGFGLAHLGELELAETLIQRAFQLNPFAPAEYHADLAVLLALSGQREAAEEHFEVCNEHRLLYQVVRLGNLHALDEGAPRLSVLQKRFVEAFLDVWQQGQAPAGSDLIEWIDYTLCLKRPEHRQPIVDSAMTAWLIFAREALDNRS